MGIDTEALGINNRGQIVGTYRNISNPYIPLDFLYSDGTYTTLTDPAADGGFTVASGINDRGQIVGFYVGSSGYEYGFLYSGGTYTNLAFPLATDTQANGINDLGQIVGSYEGGTGGGGGLLLTPCAGCRIGETLSLAEALPTSAPETSTWAMMLLGFAGLGFAGYRRARAGHAPLAA